MKAGDLIDLLKHYDNDDEIEIEICETITLVSTSILQPLSESWKKLLLSPTLRIDVEAGKFKIFL